MKANGYDKLQQELLLDDVETQEEFDFSDSLPELTEKLKAISPRRENPQSLDEETLKDPTQFG